MTVDVLDAAVGLAALDGRAEDRAGLEGGPGDWIGRGSLPVGEPSRVVGDAPVDQAVFDAEFVAMVLAEAPCSGPRPAPATLPPGGAIGTRRAPAPRSPGDQPAPTDSSRTATGVLREARRRPGPGPRSPPCPHG